MVTTRKTVKPTDLAAPHTPAVTHDPADLGAPHTPAVTHDPAVPGPAADHTGGPNSDAAEHAVQATSTHLHFTIGDTRIEITTPPANKIAFYIGLTGAAAFGLIEWPIAALTAIGHLLSDDRGNRALRTFGEALDAA